LWKKLQERRSQAKAQQQPTGKGQSTDSPTEGTGDVNVPLSNLELKDLSGRDWGRLPGHLKTEILQAARQSQTGPYAELIKFYFQEIAKPPPTSSQKHRR